MNVRISTAVHYWDHPSNNMKQVFQETRFGTSATNQLLSPMLSQKCPHESTDGSLSSHQPMSSHWQKTQHDSTKHRTLSTVQTHAVCKVVTQTETCKDERPVALQIANYKKTTAWSLAEVALCIPCSLANSLLCAVPLTLPSDAYSALGALPNHCHCALREQLPHVPLYIYYSAPEH